MKPIATLSKATGLAAIAAAGTVYLGSYIIFLLHWNFHSESVVVTLLLSALLVCLATFRFVWNKEKFRDRFGTNLPSDFRRQRIGVHDALAVADLPSSDIVSYFRANPDIGSSLLLESVDKRYSPSTFITDDGNGFTVGWYSRRTGYSCQQQFDDLADAATDYLLFSLGKGRWHAQQSSSAGNR